MIDCLGWLIDVTPRVGEKAAAIRAGAEATAASLSSEHQELLKAVSALNASFAQWKDVDPPSPDRRRLMDEAIALRARVLQYLGKIGRPQP